ncbi:hypothetical protein AB0N28_02060 [Streptomyces sp. NPDC051130]|uniref:hypothetical protein n=1 Tax=Streptomyces sp. NPDC051130 TaxID=3157223 RepID=UPI00343CC955
MSSSASYASSQTIPYIRYTAYSAVDTSDDISDDTDDEPRGCTWHCGGGGGGGGRGSLDTLRKVVKIIRPIIDQNPNNGKDARPAPNHIPTPNWDPSKGNWQPGDGVNLIAGALDLLNMLVGGNQAFTPNQTPGTHGAPGAAPGVGNNQGDPRDCVSRGQQRIDYGTLDSQNGDRPTGITACLDRARLSKGTPANQKKTKWYD